MKRRIFVGLVCASALLVNRSTLRAGQPVKDFILPSATDASLIRLSDHAGHVVLINWWRTSCAWSQKESPRLVALYQKYHPKGLVIIGVSDDTADTVAEVPAYLKRYGITWPVGLNDQGEFMRDIRPQGQGDTPGNYLVSRSGQLTYLGLDRTPADSEKLERAVAQAVAEPTQAGRPIAPATPSPAPPFSLHDLNGKPVGLSNFAGKPLVVNFFTSQNCDWAGTTLSKLQREYSARGLQVVGIDLFDENPAIQSCNSKHQTLYPVLRGDQATQLAWIGKPAGWATFFVTPDGKILKAIEDSIDNGLEATVFPRYADQLVSRH